MILSGDKVILRAIELADKDILRNMINDGEMEYLLGGWSFPVSDLKQEDWIKSLDLEPHVLRCMIDSKQEHSTTGTVILSDIDYINGTAQIHIKLLKSFRGKGFGTDTIKTMVRYAFSELRLQCIYAHINDYNIGSHKLFEKSGFKKEGVLRSRIYKNGTHHNLFVYSVLRGDFYGNRE